MIALALDAAYAPWAGTLMRSYVEVSRSTPTIFEVLHEGSLSESECAAMAQVLEGSGSEVRFHGVGPDLLRGLPSTQDFGTIVWLRFFLPELLKDRSRVLYLDSDTFVAASLDDLWETALGEAPLAAVANVVEPGAREHVRQIGVEYPGGFFNSGALLMDLGVMRAQGATEQLVRFAVDHRDELLWPDQDALNAVFAHRWLPLHPRWNAQNSFWAWRVWAVEVFGERALAEATASPAIRHFEGPNLSKPWHYLCRHPGRDQYRRVLACTPWAARPLEDRTLATRAIRRLPGPWQLGAYKLVVRSRRRRA